MHKALTPRTPPAPPRKREIDPLTLTLWIVLLVLLTGFWIWIGYHVIPFPSDVLFAMPYFVYPPDLAKEIKPEGDPVPARCVGCRRDNGGCDDDNVCTRRDPAVTLFDLADTHPDQVRAFTGRGDAHTYASAQTPKHTVTLFLSDRERSDWETRERRRFQSHDYLDLPWCKEGRAVDGRFDWSGDPTEGDAYDTEEWKAIRNIHYAHLSTQYPDMIAYTPSEEHGYQDRQVRIKAGRYIEQFLKRFASKRQRDEWINYIRAIPHGFAVCKDADEIQRAYTGNRLDSCMGKNECEYRSPIHPVRIYADSPDLKVAYVGEIDKVRARCVIWPEKKLYCRIYGDEILRVLLHKAGYSNKHPNGEFIISPSGAKCGVFDGARMPVVLHGNRAIMPYLDCATSADKSEDGKHWILRHDEEGEIGVRDADYLAGFANMGDGVEDEDDHEVRYCNRGDCDNEIGEYDTYCDSCEDDRIGCCARCGEDQWEGDDTENVDGDMMCSSCASRYQRSCDDCHDTWFSRNRPDHGVCDDCEGNYRMCDDCDTRYDHTSEGDSEVCAECLDEREEERERDGRALPRFGDLVLTRNHPNVRTREIVRVLASSGPFAVHVRIGRTGYTVTHTPSSLAVYFSEDLDLASRVAFALSLSSLDWTLTEGFSYEHSSELSRIVGEVTSRPDDDPHTCACSSCRPECNAETIPNRLLRAEFDSLEEVAL